MDQPQTPFNYNEVRRESYIIYQQHVSHQFFSARFVKLHKVVTEGRCNAIDPCWIEYETGRKSMTDVKFKILRRKKH